MGAPAATAARPTRSRALDDLIMGTNSSSIVSKRSVERLYYPDEPHYFRYFVRKFQRRSPLINRGYWLRLRAIDTIVRQFVTRASSRRRAVVNLGCGSDVLPWQCNARYGEACRGTLFVDIDYPDLMRRKRDVVLETPQLRDLLGDDPQVDDSGEGPVVLRSERYCQLGCDLRQLDAVRQALGSLLNLPDCDILFVAEVSITYMDTHSADSLIHWASSIGNAEFCLLEQIIPHGPAHPFAKTMLAHFDKLSTPPRSVHEYPTVDSQRARFRGRGWQHVDIWDLWDAWSGDDFVTTTERAALDLVEPFDETEEFMLFARHYFVLHASASPSSGHTASALKPPVPPQKSSKMDIKVAVHHPEKAPKRRFGAAFTLSNPEGQPFTVHMMGTGAKGRSDTWDVYAAARGVAPPKLPLVGPGPRACCTVTDLGDFGILLAGGRGSPANALSDCWLFEKGADPHWKTAPSLPIPLFRHSALRLRGSSLVLVMGGRTGQAQISDKFFVFHPDRGWLRCAVLGEKPEPFFGAVACNSSTFDAATGTGQYTGLLSGGLGQSGTVLEKSFCWRLDMAADAQPNISFTAIQVVGTQGRQLSLFGASVVEMGPYSAICGGIGQDASCLGQTIATVSVSDDGCRLIGVATPAEHKIHDWPFMIGSSVMAPSGSKLIVVGGGATCFSMGTFWETGVYSLTLPGGLATPSANPALTMEYLESPKLVASRSAVGSDPQPPSTARGAARATVTAIPRIRLRSSEHFVELLRDRKPVVIQGLDLGSCLDQWTPGYMVERVGHATEVTVHECHADTEKMDFNSKNFRYVAESFGTLMDKIQTGGRLYLRSLSRANPSEAPANLEDDFPSLAADFRLPPELDYVRENLFSSVLRASGRVNMWLHYDVMANVYSQIKGSKRMALFPPPDVAHLAFAPGASSSSLDVFSALATPALAGTHPYEAMLSPGDVLLLPAAWLHTAAPITDMSVAVNVFFRDLDSGYSAGRDVYGNRDLAAYEKGRQDAARIARGFRGLPPEIRRFYLLRLADELLEAREAT